MPHATVKKRWLAPGVLVLPCPEDRPTGGEGVLVLFAHEEFIEY